MPISDREGLLVLETKIRELLQCQGTQCAFLQTMEYSRLKQSILLRLARVLFHEPPLHARLPNTELVLTVEDAEGASVTATISVKETCWVDAAEGERPRKLPGQSRFGQFERQVRLRRRAEDEE